MTLMLARIRDFVQTKVTDASGEPRKVFGKRLCNEAFAEIFAFLDRYSLDSVQIVCRRFNTVIAGKAKVSLRLLHSAKIDATTNEVVVKVKPAVKDLGRLITEAYVRRFSITGDAVIMLLKVCCSAAVRKLAFKSIPILTKDVLTVISENASSIYVRFLDLDKEIDEHVTGTAISKAVRSFGGVYSLQLRPLATADENRHIVNALPIRELRLSRISYFGGINDSGLEDDDILKFCFERSVCCGLSIANLSVDTTRITPSFVQRLVQAAKQSSTAHQICLSIRHCVEQNLSGLSLDAAFDDSFEVEGSFKISGAKNEILWNVTSDYYPSKGRHSLNFYQTAKGPPWQWLHCAQHPGL